MTAAKASNQNAIVVLVMAVVLSGGAVIALMSHAGEFPPSPYHLFVMGLDGVMTIALAILVATLGSSPPGGLRTAATIIGPIGVVAGIVKVGIRFTSDHAWWTGNYLPPVFS
ncbi:MAG: hypothetical protein ACRCS3_08150 [Paracoccaceae bacterium]